MKCRMVAAVSLLLVVGLVAWAFVRQSDAQGQGEQKKLEWEYKVVAFKVDNENSRDVDTHTKQITPLAAEGWEYVGLLCAGSNSVHSRGVRVPGGGVTYPITSGGNVLFKRPKR
jgi:hypothetical protein